MSTKNLREMMSQYEDMIGSSTSEVGSGAKKELEAIEKAAKEWASSYHGELTEESGNVMESIAKDAP